jgi:hypothetical protein
MRRAAPAGLREFRLVLGQFQVLVGFIDEPFPLELVQFAGGNEQRL